jgi:hypothetical protein
MKAGARPKADQTKIPVFNSTIDPTLGGEFIPSIVQV